MMQEKTIGLALGAGGVLGGAWLAGALTALRHVVGWEPAAAQAIVGTSAGSVFAALLSAGTAAAGLLPRPAAAGERWLLGDLMVEEAYRRGGRRPWAGPGSFGMVIRGLRERAALRAICGLVPRGLVPTAAIEACIRRAVPSGWAPRPGCWIVACDYSTGERVVFGREDAPAAPLAGAVAASCAIPGFFRPVALGGRLYVDGGLHSLTNLDVLAGRRLDLVVALNPMAGTPPRRGWSPLGRLTAAMRRRSARQFAVEAAEVVRNGTEVLLLEPTDRDLAEIGDDVMDARRAARVAQVAFMTTAEELRRPSLRPLLRKLVRARA